MPTVVAEIEEFCGSSDASQVILLWSAQPITTIRSAYIEDVCPILIGRDRNLVNREEWKRLPACQSHCSTFRSVGFGESIRAK